MTPIAVKRTSITGTALPIVTLAVIGMAITAHAIGGNVLALLVRWLHTDLDRRLQRPFSAGVAGIISFVLFLAGVVIGLAALQAIGLGGRR